MANIEDFPPIFCLTADFLPEGGDQKPCKIFTSASRTFRHLMTHFQLNNKYLNIFPDDRTIIYEKHRCIK